MSYFIIKLLDWVIMPAFLPTALCCISISLFYRKEINMKELKKYFFTCYLINIVLLSGSYVITLPILSIISVFLLKDNKDKNKVKILITIYSADTINMLASLFVFLLLNEKANKYNIGLSKYQVIGFFITFAIMLIVWIISRTVGAKIKVENRKSFDKVRFQMILSISVPFTLIIFLIFVISYVSKNKIEEFIPEILPLAFILLIVAIIYNYDRAVEISLKLNREIEEKKEIEEYSRVIEGMYSETRRFKHDYINMLSPLKVYIDSNDMEGLREFFYSNVVDMDKNIQWNNSNIDKLKYIKETGLKAILSTKLIKAVSMNIDIKVEILEEINEASMNIMDLCRIVGILMDNAIEASIECEYPKLSLCAINKDEYLLIAVQNNFFGDKPLIHKIYKEGFSTKGSGRGLGLYTVKNILDTKYDNAFLDTSIENNMFIQELWIKSPR